MGPEACRSASSSAAVFSLIGMAPVEVVEGVLCSSDRVHTPVVLAMRVSDLVAVCILSPFWEWLGCEGHIGVLFALSLELEPQRWWDWGRRMRRHGARLLK
jgi:hypothetical protein